MLGEIETPTALIKSIETNGAVIEKYIPHLPDKLKEQQCGDIDFPNQPSINPVTSEDRGMKMREQSDDYFKLYTWSIVNMLAKYIHDQHIQSVRISAYYIFCDNCVIILKKYQAKNHTKKIRLLDT